MRRVYKNLCPATIGASIMAANMWKNCLKNVESDNNKTLYETLLDFFLQRNGTYFLNKPRICSDTGCTYFPKMLQPPQNTKQQKGDIKQSLYWMPTNVSMCVGGRLRIAERNGFLRDRRYKLDNKWRNGVSCCTLY